MDSNNFLYGKNKKYLKSKHTADLGIIKCEEFFMELGWITRVINQKSDVGIDLIVEITHRIKNEEKFIPSGILFGIQVKSGKYYYYRNARGSEYFIINSSDKNKKNWDYWVKHQLPIFIFFYYDNNMALFSISKWLNYEKYWENKNPLPIKSYKIYKFNDKENYKQIEQKILEGIQEKAVISDILPYIDTIYQDDNNALESIVILSKHRQIRYSSILGLLFPHILLSKDDKTVQGSFICLQDWIYTMERLEENEKKNVLEFAQKIMKNLSIEIWIRILSTIHDHNLFEIDNGINKIGYLCDLPDCLYFLNPLGDEIARGHYDPERGLNLLTKENDTIFLMIAKNKDVKESIRIDSLALHLFGVNANNYYIGNDEEISSYKFNSMRLILLEEIKDFLLSNNLLDFVCSYYNIDKNDLLEFGFS